MWCVPWCSSTTTCAMLRQIAIFQKYLKIWCIFHHIALHFTSPQSPHMHIHELIPLQWNLGEKSKGTSQLINFQEQRPRPLFVRCCTLLYFYSLLLYYISYSTSHNLMTSSSSSSETESEYSEEDKFFTYGMSCYTL